MIMTHLFPCILFVLMCHRSKAGFTATLPLGTSIIPTGTCIKYNTILCNTGMEYNAGSGIFTVLTNGTYSVSVSMMSGYDVTAHTTLRRTSPSLMIIDKIMVWLYTGKLYDMASQTINCELTVNDTLCVRMQSGIRLYSVYNTFTAVRIS